MLAVSSACSERLGMRQIFELNPQDHFVLHHSLPDGKACECPLAAMCMAISKKA